MIEQMWRRPVRAAWVGGVLLALLGCGSFGASTTDAPSMAQDAGDAGAPADAKSVESARSGPCADGLEGWSTPWQLTELVGDDGALHFQDPFVSADGLTLWANKIVGSEWAVYRGTRASRSEPFKILTKQKGISTPDYSRPYPSMSSPSELVITIPVGGASLEIGAGTLAPTGDWTVSPYEELNRPDADLWSTISADGLVLVYVQRGASPNNPFETLYQVERAAPLRSSPWGSKRELSESAVGTTLPTGLSYPALMPDGLGLFYTRDGAPGLFYAKRTTRSAPFFTAASQPVQVVTFGRLESTTRVRSMTVDGCELYLMSDRDGYDDVYVATKTN